MITITHSYNTADRHIWLSVKGHANFAPHGQDIVCASASILLHTVVETIEAMERLWYFTKPPNISLVPGNGIVEVYCVDDTRFAETLRVTLFALTGYKVLAEGYPQYVEIKQDVKA